MFTIEQLKAAHAQVKSGADYPAYVQEIIKLGVNGYTTYVSDGHTVFYGKNNQEARWDAKYAEKEIADESNKEQFLADIKAHQLGKSDYPTFCAQCAQSGIEKWIVDTARMTCTYYDKAGNEILAEVIPGA